MVINRKGQTDGVSPDKLRFIAGATISSEPFNDAATTPTTVVPKAGDHVSHSMFGDGIVVNCTPIKDDHEVIVAFGEGMGIKKLLLSLAPMEMTSTLVVPATPRDSTN